MDWHNLLNPTGDERPEVYWRRRIVVVTLLLMFVVAVALLFGGGSSSNAAARRISELQVSSPPPTPSPTDPAPSPTDSPSASASASPSATPSDSTSPSPSASPSSSAAAGTCTPSSLAVRVAPDSLTYRPGQEPLLALTTVLTPGAAPCSVDLGSDNSAISVLAAGHAVWSSDACITTKSAHVVQVTSSMSRSLQLHWTRTGNVDHCAAPVALPAGSYELVGHVGSTTVYGGGFTIQSS